MALFDPLSFLPGVHACANGSKVQLGPNAKRLPVDELAAVIAHEHGHIVLKHRRERVKWLLTLKWLDFDMWRAMCWDQEVAADLWAVRNGHGPGLARYLNRRSFDKHLPGFWHPPAIFRLDMIEQFERAKNAQQ